MHLAAATHDASISAFGTPSATAAFSPLLSISAASADARARVPASSPNRRAHVASSCRCTAWIIPLHPLAGSTFSGDTAPNTIGFSLCLKATPCLEGSNSVSPA